MLSAETVDICVLDTCLVRNLLKYERWNTLIRLMGWVPHPHINQIQFIGGGGALNPIYRIQTLLRQIEIS